MNLRPFEAYTRYWDSLGSTEDFYRANDQGNDPETYIMAGCVRGNGTWDLAPDLAGVAYRRAVYSESGLIHASEEGGAVANLVPQVQGIPGEITFQVYGANIVTSADVHLEGIRSGAEDAIILMVSADAGLHWETIWQAAATDLSCPGAGGAPESAACAEVLHFAPAGALPSRRNRH